MVSITNHARLVQRCTRMLLVRKEVERRRNACNILKEFMKSTARLSPIEAAAQRFISKVRLAQRFWRGYMAVTKARMMLLSLQWNRIEIERLHLLAEGANSPPRFSSTADAASPSVRSSFADSASPANKRSGGLQKKSSSNMSGRASAAQSRQDTVRTARFTSAMPFVPRRVRELAIKGLLHSLRVKYKEDLMMWEQKVIMKAQSTPELQKDPVARRLSVIQIDLQRRQMEIGDFSRVTQALDGIAETQKKKKEATRRFKPTFASFDEDKNADMQDQSVPMMKRFRMSIKRKKERDEYDGSVRRVHIKHALVGKAGFHASLETSSNVINEVRKRMPRPYARVLAPHEDMVRIFELAIEQCKREDTWDMHRSAEDPLEKEPDVSRLSFAGE